MLIETKGDLLKADVDALVNPVNCVGVMGKGLALQFKRAYPLNYTQYKESCYFKYVVPGNMHITTNRKGRVKYIINFPTKRHWRNKSILSDIEDGLKSLAECIVDYKIKSIAIPPLGCGNGGLDWDDVYPLIEEHLGHLRGVDIYLYVPSK